MSSQVVQVVHCGQALVTISWAGQTAEFFLEDAEGDAPDIAADFLEHADVFVELGEESPDATP